MAVTLTISDAARASGVSAHTLRYYERAGLLDPIRRQSSSRHRRYAADDVARLRTLACLRAAGMPMAQMRRYFELLALGAAAAPLQLEMLVAQREVLQARRRELDDHARYLDGKVAYWQAVQSGDRASAAQIASRLSPCGQPAARPSSPRHP
jgi:MerR family transcriptional regulator, aldehyde-responsive regulator